MPDTQTADARRLAVDILSDYASGESLQGELNRVIGTHDLASEDRGLLTELVLSTYRNRSWLRQQVVELLSGDWSNLPDEIQWTLLTALHQITALDRIPDYAAVDEAVELAKHYNHKLSGLVNGVLRNYLRKHEDGSMPDSPAPGAGGYFKKQLRLAFGEDAAGEILDTVGERYYTGIWFEPGSDEAEELRHELRNHGHLLYADVGGYRFPYLLSMPEGGAESVRERGAHLMGVGSQLVARIAGEVALHLPDSRLNVLDAAAGRGGKALYLAHFLSAAERDFTLTLADSNPGKLGTAREKLDELGVATEFVEADMSDAEAAREAGLDGEYDLVLLDAPCTGSGSFRKLPHKLSYLEPAEADKLKPLQWRMLKTAFELTAREGVLLYAVCSFLPEEGEFQIHRAAEELAEFQPLPPPIQDEPPVFQAGYTVRTAPVEPWLEGFTIATARKGLLQPDELDPAKDSEPGRI